MPRHPVVRLKVFEFLCSYKEENDGHPPSYEEICKHFGWTSFHTAWYHVQGLERDGLVKLDRNRRITLIGGLYDAPDTPLPEDNLGSKKLRTKARQ